MKWTDEEVELFLCVLEAQSCKLQRKPFPQSLSYRISRLARKLGVSKEAIWEIMRRADEL